MPRRIRICAAFLALIMLLSACGNVTEESCVTESKDNVTETEVTETQTDVTQTADTPQTDEEQESDADAGLQPDASAEAESEPEPQPEPEPEPVNMEVLWASVFRNSHLPMGYTNPDVVAFYNPSNPDEPIVTVTFDELIAATDAIEMLPRTHYYDQFVDDSFDTLFRAMDYAMYNGYTRFVWPSYENDDKWIMSVQDIIQRCYNLNSAFFSVYTSARKTNEYGQELYYNLLSFSGMELNDSLAKYRQSLDKAAELIAMLPEDATDYDKVFFFYSWLTENVRYDDNDYYGGEDWNLAYDALILNNTVCAGYAMAFYYLCNMAGVDCINIIGYVGGDRVNGGHMWNKACIDGRYYIFDATWDEGVDPESYRFFGISDSRLQSLSVREMSDLDNETMPDCLLSLMRK